LPMTGAKPLPQLTAHHIDLRPVLLHAKPRLQLPRAQTAQEMLRDGLVGSDALAQQLADHHRHQGGKPAA